MKRLDAKAGTFFDNRKIQVVITGDAIPASAVEQLTREITTVLGGLGFGSSDTAKSETLSIVLATGESIDLTKESFVLSPRVGYSCELKAEAQWGAAFRLSLGKRGVGLTTVAACLKARADEIPGLATFRIVEAWSKANP